MGQVRLLAGRRRIVTELKKPGIPRQRKRKMRIVLLARAFAFETLGLKRTQAYTLLYDTGGKPIAHNLSAAPRDRLEAHTWRFPIVGALPYLGFFSRTSALRFQQRLAQRDLDTYLRPVSAFSSLGFFSDPVFSSLLDGPEDRLVELIIHESTHTTIFLRGEVGFNESLAVFVGQQGTLQFLAELHGPHSAAVAAAQRRFRRRALFALLIAELADKLRELYARSISRADKLKERGKLFAWAKEQYHRRIGDTQSRFMRRKLNNAVVLSYGRYLRGLSFQRSVFRCAGKDLARMLRLYLRANALSDRPVTAVARACGLKVPPQRM